MKKGGEIMKVKTNIKAGPEVYVDGEYRR